MRRKLALFMVVAMLISLVPMNVFAGSANTMSSVPTVGEDWNFKTDGGALPSLRIEEADAGDFVTTQVFKLKLENADWSDNVSASVLEADMATYSGTNNNDSGTWSIAYDLLSDSTMQVSVSGDGAGSDELYFKIPMYAIVDAEGIAKVSIDAMDSTITEGTFTFAKVAEGDTKASIDEVQDLGDTGAIDPIVIEELSIGTLKASNGTYPNIKVKLTTDEFNWVAGATATLGGGFQGTATVTPDTDKEELTIALTVTNTPSARGIVTLNNLQIDPSSDAEYGDVKVKVSGDEVTTETLVVAKYVESGITVEADDEDADLPVLYSGDMEVLSSATGKTYGGHEQYAKGAGANGDYDVLANYTNEDHLLSVLVIEEVVADSLDVGKDLSIEFPEWVKILNVEKDDSDYVYSTGTTAITTADLQAALTPGDSDIELDNLVGNDAQVKSLSLKFYVTVEADAPAGDIKAKVSGKAVGGESYEVVLGKVVAPITAKVESKDVRIGLQDQETGTITITEGDAGVIGEGASNDEIVVTLADDIEWASTPTVKVTKGDLEIDEVSKSDNVLTITIEDESTEASTIEISGAKVDLNRTVPEGDFNVEIGGSALVQNNVEDDGDFVGFETDSVVDVVYARVITPTDYNTTATQTVVFTIGSADYTVGDAKVTSDAAPYINAQGRTMLPLRALANALGVMDTNILWNDAEHSVTIFKGDATVKVIIGQMSFMKNGVMIPMDTQAVILNGRTMLPLRAIGQALGATVTWDEATKTITVK